MTFNTENTKSTENGLYNHPLSHQVIGCAIEVHRHLGPGLLESAYEQCLAHELSQAGLEFKVHPPMPVEYRDIKLDCGYRPDIVVENFLIIERKAVEQIAAIHRAQLLTYMRLAEATIGLLINFNTMLLKDGISKFVL